ncbi:Wzz/FepE/Etk N-terminal domain-containing protein [Pseudomonas sp. NPDC090233]|uniref:Wzz/FepE/Etk N-terminal domain-containing protein n=1 Tax=Pseudomonas sp. NPDC090233 TaxID=3364479 RepID=UPI00383A6461
MSTDDVRRNGNSDEVNLVELVRQFWKERFLILAVTLLFLLLAVAYLFIKAPLYEAKATVREPSQGDIATLNIGRGEKSGLKLLDVKDVYSVYLRNLQSEAVRREFFDDVYVPDMRAAGYEVGGDEAYSRFSSGLRIDTSDANQSARATVAILANQPKTAVYWVQLYSNLAASQATRQLLSDLRSDAKTKADNLEQQIEIDRESARKQREDKLIQLREALRIARSIGLEKPPFISANLSAELSSEISGGLTYMRGSKALEAEIGILEARVSDDPYIQGLRQKQADVAFYRKLGFDSSGVEVYQLDGDVMLPDRPTKPRVALTIVAAGLLGLLIGLVLVAARNVFRDVRQG